MTYRLWVGFRSGNTREWINVEEKVYKTFHAHLTTGEPIVLDSPSTSSIVMPATVEYAIFREVYE